LSTFSTDVNFVSPVETEVKFLDEVDVHLDELTGTVKSVGKVGPVKLDGIPDDYTFHTSIDKVPKLRIGVDPVHFAVDSLPKVTFGIDPVELRLTEIPSVRAHLPADYSVGLSVFGVELLCIRLCGEGQIITEPYRPNACEHCGPQPQGQTIDVVVDRQDT
jgi:hypothetical protein